MLIFYPSMVAKAFAIQCTQLEGKNFLVGGEKERVVTSETLPVARRRTEKSKLSIVKARSEGYYSHLHQHPSDQLVSLPNKQNKVHKNTGDSW